MVAGVIRVQYFVIANETIFFGGWGVLNMNFVMNENNSLSFLCRASNKASSRRRGKLTLSSFVRYSARKLFRHSSSAKKSSKSQPELSSQDKDESDESL